MLNVAVPIAASFTKVSLTSGPNRLAFALAAGVGEGVGVGVGEGAGVGAGDGVGVGVVGGGGDVDTPPPLPLHDASRSADTEMPVRAKYFAFMLSPRKIKTPM